MDNLTTPTLPAICEAPTEEAACKRVYSPFVKRNSRLLRMLCTALLGIIIGSAVIALPQRADLSSIAALRTDGSFLQLMMMRFAGTGIILAAEYAIGYSALGGWIVWAAPLISGMGVGLSAAYMLSSGNGAILLLLMPSAIGSTVLCSFGADSSAEFSYLLLRLVSGNKNSIVMTGSSSGAYTLRFGIYLAILLLISIYEAAAKLSSV